MLLVESSPGLLRLRAIHQVLNARAVEPEALIGRAVPRLQAPATACATQAELLTDLFGTEAGAAAERRAGLAIDEADPAEAMRWLEVQSAIRPASY